MVRSRRAHPDTRVGHRARRCRALPQRPSGGSIRLVSKGTAIEETIGTPADNETSLYTHQGASVLLTHFCALTPGGHIARLALQPRHGTQPLEFVFVGASNLSGPNAAHMRRVLISFTDRAHFREQWTRSENGKDTIFDVHFVRR